VEGDRNRLLFLAVMCWTRRLGWWRDTAMIAVLVKWSQARCLGVFRTERGLLDNSRTYIDRPWGFLEGNRSARVQDLDSEGSDGKDMGLTTQAPVVER
jgi:hypothetical protein